MRITADYRFFHTEWDGDETYDRFIVYNGPSFTSQFVRQDFGLFMPPQFPFPETIIANNANGVLTFGWVCNGSETYRGWAIEIGCVSNPLSFSSMIESEKAVSIYPNPTEGSFTIKSAKVVKYAILSIEGNELFSGRLTIGDNKINTALAKGIYFVKIEGEIQKLVIQ